MRLHREGQGRPTRELAVDPSLGLPAPDGSPHALEIAAQLEHIARFDEALEPAFIDTGEQREPPAVFLLAQHRHGTGLCERLDDQHAGHHRTAREVAAQVPLVLAHRLPSERPFTRSELEHLVDQEEGLAVGKDLLDRFPAERRGNGHATSESLSRSWLRPRCA